MVRFWFETLAELCVSSITTGEIFCHSSECMAAKEGSTRPWPEVGDYVRFTLMRQDRRDTGQKLLAAKECDTKHDHMMSMILKLSLAV